MERRTALTAAAATAFSVLAIGTAITTNLRPDDAKASTSSEVESGTSTALEPTIVTIVVPAADGSAASSTPRVSGPAPAGVVRSDDHGDDHDELEDHDDDEHEDHEDEHEDD